MKHQMLTIRLPDGLLDAYRNLSLDGRKSALEAMRRALQESCQAGRAPRPAPSAVEDPVPSSAEPSVTQQQEPPSAPGEADNGVSENPFPDLMKGYVSDAGW